MTVGEGLMRRVNGIETGYLNTIRVMLAVAVILGVVSVAAAVVWFVFVQLATFGQQAPSDHFEAPAWGSIRHQVLPPVMEQPASTGTATDHEAKPAGGRQPVDERVVRIAEYLNAQFHRNPGDETGFTDHYPRRLLQTWIFEESGLPQAYLTEYISELTEIAELIGQDERINRIGSLDDRAQVIMSALDAFRQEFLVRIRQAENRAATANAAAVERRAGATALSLFLGLGGLGLLVSLILIMVLVRIETHLRNPIDLRTHNHGDRLIPQTGIEDGE